MLKESCIWNQKNFQDSRFGFVLYFSSFATKKAFHRIIEKFKVLTFVNGDGKIDISIRKIWSFFFIKLIVRLNWPSKKEPIFFWLNHNTFCIHSILYLFFTINICCDCLAWFLEFVSDEAYHILPIAETLFLVFVQNP